MNCRYWARNVATLAASACALGCHTLDAAIRLAQPSGTYEIEMKLRIVGGSPSAGLTQALLWDASYGESSYPDNISVGLFVRSTTLTGALPLPVGATLCVPTPHGPRRFLPNDPHPIILDQQTPRLRPDAIRDSTRDLARKSGCTHLMSVRESTEPFNIQSVAFDSLANDKELQLLVPPERPLRDVRRWGWLLAGPVLDVATIAVLGPAFIVFGAIDVTR
jgi:hypothetical protein